jgi:glycerophosphoryl diester phosphodiesterase
MSSGKHIDNSIGWIVTQPIAHRGLHSPQEPENSLGAFRAAIAANFAIELDVHRTKDNKLVIIHDANTHRATGVDHLVTDKAHVDLRELKLFGSNYGILILTEVLAEIKGQVPLLVEVKTGSTGDQIGPLIVRAFEGYGGQYAVMSFDPRILLWFKKYAPSVPRGLLSGTMRYPGYDLNPIIRLLLQSMISVAVCKPQFIAYDVDAADSKALRFWRRTTKLPLLLWPVLTPAHHEIAKKMHANVIFEKFNSDPYR